VGYFECGIALQAMNVNGNAPLDHELEAHGIHRLEADATMGPRKLTIDHHHRSLDGDVGTCGELSAGIAADLDLQRRGHLDA